MRHQPYGFPVLNGILKITVQYINNEITYKDSKGQKMLIFDPEDDKFIDFYHPLK